MMKPIFVEENSMPVAFGFGDSAFITGVSAPDITPSFSAPPGVPFADYNAQGLNPGNVTTWVNDGSDATDSLSTFGSANAPECIAAGAGSPVPGVKYIRFDLANTEALQGALTTTRTSEVVFAGVVRWVGGVGGSGAQSLFDGNDVNNRMQLSRRAFGSYYDWAIASGTTVGSACQVEKDKWVRVVGRLGVGGTASLSVERALRVTNASCGTEDLAGLTIGAAYDGTLFANLDVARLVFWDDGTTMLEAEAWLEENYYFPPVPPGNPSHWYDPNDYPLGTLVTVIDKGSGGIGGIAGGIGVSLSVVQDPQCPEQKVFDISTGGYIVSSTMALSGEVMTVASMRPTTQNVVRNFYGQSSGGTNEIRCYLDANNKTARNHGLLTTADPDLDTVGEFKTSRRWVYIASYENDGGLTGRCWVDGVLGTGSNTGDNAATGMAFGARWDGAAYVSPLNGYMSDILIYEDIDVGGAGSPRHFETGRWLKRHRRLATLPGVPFVDADVQPANVTETGGLVDALVNDGSEGNFSKTGSNRPNYITDDGPEPGLSEVSIEFDQSGTNQRLDSPTFTAKTQPITSLIVHKITTFPTSAGLVLGASNTGATACQPRILHTAPNDSATDAGTTQGTGVAVTLNKWHWHVAEHSGATSRVVDSEGADTGDVNAGSESHGTVHRIGDNPAGNSQGVHRQARHLYWDDGTTWEQAKAYAEMRYPGVDPY